MSHRQDRELEPYPGTVEIGYKLTKARLKFREPESYLSDAIGAIQAIRAPVVDDARKRGVRANEHDVSQVMSILNGALHAQIQYHASPGSADYARIDSAAESIGYAHKLISDLMQSYGYRDITLEDFKEFGSGGSR